MKRIVPSYACFFSVVFAVCSFSQAFAQISTSFPGGCPISTSYPLDENCISIFDPSALEGTFVAGSGGILDFLYDGIQPGEPVLAGHGTTILTTMEVRERNALGNIIDSLFCDLTIAYLDQSKPQVSCPTNISLIGSCQMVTGIDPFVFESCDEDYSFTHDIIFPIGSGFESIYSAPGSASSQIFPVGITTVIYHFPSDAHGNQPSDSSCSLSVQINGSATLPQIVSCPDDVTITSENESCGTQVQLSPVSAIDPCIGNGSLIITNSYNSGGSDASGFYPVGKTTVVFTAYNPNTAKASSCSSEVLVIDDFAPDTVGCPGVITVELRLDDTYSVIEGDDFVEDVTVLDCALQLDLNLPNFKDNCSINSSISYRVIPFNGIPVQGIPGDENDPDGNFLFKTGNYQIKYEAIDESYNYANCSFEINIEDLSPPIITCPSVQGIYSTSFETCEAIFSEGELDPLVVENCGLSQITYTITFPDNTDQSGLWQSGIIYNFPPGVSVLEYEAEDLNGNSQSCQVNINVQDLVAPEFNCPEDISVNPSPGMTLVNVSIPHGASDNCGLDGVDFAVTLPGGGLLLGSGNASFINFPFGLSSVVYTAADEEGNEEVCSFSVYVDPIFPTCPVLLPDAFLNSNCRAQIDPSVVKDNYFKYLPDTTNFPVVTFLGNGTFTAIPNADDPDPAPVFFNLVDGANLVSDPGTYSVDYAVQVFDSMGELLVSNNPCRVIVKVIDNNQPQIICPDDLTIAVNNEIADPAACPLIPAKLGFDLLPDINENCTITDTVFYLFDSVGDSYFTGHGSAGEAYFNPGLTTVRYIVTDNYGNQDSCSFSVTIFLFDSTSPVLNCPGDLLFNLQNPNSCDTIFSNGELEVSAIDSCNVSPLPLLHYYIDFPDGSSLGPIMGNDAGLNGSIFPLGTSWITYEAIDDNDNSVVCKFAVSVLDPYKPNFITACPSAVIVENMPGSCSALVFGIDPPDFSDNCQGGMVRYVLAGSTEESGVGSVEGKEFNAGLTVVTYTVIDSSGNESQACSFTVVVEDSEVPQLGCPGNVQIDAGSNCETAVFGLNPNVTDNCPDHQLTYVLVYPGGIIETGMGSVDGFLFPLGLTSLQYSVRDAQGNYAQSCLVTINVVDSEPPILLNCPDNMTITLDPGLCETWIDIQPLILSDNCDDSPLVNNSFSADGNDASGFYPLGVTNVQFNSIDESGNNASCSFSVTVLTNSLGFCIQDTIVSMAVDSCWTAVYGLEAGMQCDSVIFEITFPDNSSITGSGSASGTYFPLGLSTVDYSIYDVNDDLSIECSFTVEIVDDNPPEFLACPPDISMNAAGMCEVLIFLPMAAAFDNCGNVQISNDFNSGGSNASGNYPIGTTIVTFVAMDDNGNSADCQTRVTVSDPGIGLTCPVDTSLSVSSPDCAVDVFDISPTVAGTTCDPLGIAWRIVSPGKDTLFGNGDVSGMSFPIGSNDVTYFINEPTGPQSCNFQVIVNGTITLPTCPPDITVNTNFGRCDAILPGLNVTGNDCDLRVFHSVSGATVLDLQEGNPSALLLLTGVSILNFYYEDPFSSDTISLCETKVTVTDNEPPAINCIRNVYILTDGTEASFLQPSSAIIGEINSGNGNCEIEISGLLPVFQDNCNISSLSYQIQLPNTNVISSPNTGINDVSGFFFPVGTSRVNYFLSDDFGNGDTCLIMIDIEDISNPIVECKDIILHNGVLQQPVPGLTITDQNPCHPMISGSGLTALDSCGEIVRIDVELTGATIGTAYNSGSPGISIVTGAMLGRADPFGINDIDSVLFNTGTTTVYYSIYDEFGNESSCEQKVQITESSPPFFVNCPADQTLSMDPGTCTRSFSVNPPVVGDNCPDGNLTLTYQIEYPAMSGNIVQSGNNIVNYTFPKGDTRIIWTLVDASGNNSNEQCIVLISVKDMEPPVQICPASMTFVLPALSLKCDTILNGIDAQLSDNCDLTINTTHTIVFPDQSKQGPILGFASGNAFPVGTSTVTYISVDQEGNSISCSFEIIVIDESPPAIIQCPENIQTNTDSLCFAQVGLPSLIVNSGMCTSGNSQMDIVSHQESGTGDVIISLDPGNADVLVDPVSISIKTPTAPEFAISDVLLNIYLYNIDGQNSVGDTNEYFYVLGENGDTLGKTSFAQNQCDGAIPLVHPFYFNASVEDDFTIPVALFNNWAADGSVDLTLQPNIPVDVMGNPLPSNSGINDICGNTFAKARLRYASQQPDPDFIYEISVNGDPKISPVPKTWIFELGEHTVEYFVSDQIGNTDSCTFQVEIIDIEIPEFIECPDNISELTSQCEKEIQLPLFGSIIDNCLEYGNYQDSLSQLMTFNNPDGNADDLNFDFEDHSVNVGSDGILSVYIWGDIDNIDEYFLIYDEQANLLGQTSSPGDCNTPAFLELTLSADDLNEWTIDGVIKFLVKANVTANPVTPGIDGDPNIYAVNNHCPGVSSGPKKIELILSYPTLPPISYVIDGPVNLGPFFFPDVGLPVVNFPTGLSQVTYQLVDASGNEGSCTFFVEVIDTIAPQIECSIGSTIFINPSGLIADTLDLSDLVASLSDNCEVDTFELSQSVMDCSDVSINPIEVMVWISDKSGNRDSCIIPVRVENVPLNPTFSVGICGNDTLYLFADTTVIPQNSGNIFTYQWSGPSGFVSNDANPILPAVSSMQSGTYTLTMTGFGGCSSTGSFTITINDQPNTPTIQVSDNMLCDNESFMLTTDSYSGSVVNYYWFEGVPPNGIPLDTTTTPLLNIQPQQAGVYEYYVIVEVDGCASNPSAPVQVSVIQSPFAETNEDSIQICETESIILGTSVIGPGLTYSWTGPNGFQSSLANPPAIQNASILNEGLYVLIISSADCPSDPAFTYVIVKPQPPVPAIINNSPICIGDSATLNTDILNGDQYTWTSSNFDVHITLVPTFNYLPAETGNIKWSVVVSIDGCLSPESFETEVIVDDFPIVDAMNNGPLCPGDPLQLFANSIAGASYNWEGPNGFNSSSNNPVINAISGRYYVTVTTAGGCSSIDSTDVIIKIPPVIDSIIVDVPTCVTGTEDVILMPVIIPIDDGNYTYFWEGPNGYTAVVADPEITNLDETKNGSYTLVVTDGDGCTSQPASTVIDVIEVPSTPQLNQVDPLCDMDQLILTATGGDPMVTYNWVLPGGDTVSTTSASLNIPSVSLDDDGSYIVFTTLGGCASAASDAIDIMVNPIPVTPTITGTDLVCEGDQIELETPFISNAMYSWTGPAGFSDNVFNPIIANSTVVMSGMYFLQITVNGCLSDQSIFEVTVRPKPSTPNISNNGPVCENAPITLTTDFMGGDDYRWISPSFLEYITQDAFIVLSGLQIETGEWRMEVMVNGCVSERSNATTVVVESLPSTPFITTIDTELCDGDQIKVETAPVLGNNVEYVWLTPQGTFVTTEPFYDVFQANTLATGTYSVYVSRDNCESDTSNVLNIIVYEIPATPVISSNSPVCEGDTIKLFAPMISGASYSWTGPNSFTSSNPAPVFPADRNFSGIYSLAVTVNGCTSALTSTMVNILIPEDAPLANATEKVCLDDPNACIELSINGGISGATYVWHEVASDTVVALTNETMVEICDLSEFLPNTFVQYYAIAMVAGCETSPSLPVTIELQTTPDVEANAGDSLFLCGVQTTTISAQFTGIDGFWTQICGPVVSIASPNASTTSISGLTGSQTYCFTWTLDFESCGSTSDTLIIIVDEAGETAFAGDTIDLCNITSGFLNADPSTIGALGIWSQPQVQEDLGIMISDTLDPNTFITGISPGNTYIFTWTLSNAGCHDFSSDDVIVNVMEADSTQANCGDDFVACGDGSVQLECIQPSQGDGFWTALDPDIDILTPDRANTIALGLEEGSNVFIWTLSNAICGIFSLDTLIVNYEFTPIANPDIDSVVFAGSTEIAVLDNDQIGSDYDMDIFSQPSHGTVEITPQGTILYHVDEGFASEDDFFYRLCSVTCPDECSIAKVSLRVTQVGCIPPTIITPNDDGVNDVFIIPCLETDDFPRNELSVFNQWGDEVFRAKPYFNNWDGTFKGNPLPDGTYYYVIDYGGNFPAQTNFLIIKR